MLINYRDMYKKVLALFILLSFSNYSVKAQVFTKNIDSLENAYNSRNYSKSEELKILLELSSRLKNPQKILKYSNKLIEVAKAQDSTHYFFDAYLQKGNSYRYTGDFTKALEVFFLAAKTSKNLKKRENLALVNVTIGDVYSEMGNHDSSISYHNKGIKELRAILIDTLYKKTSLDKNVFDIDLKYKIEDYLATALLNSGDEYFNAGKYDKAMSNFFESSAIFKRIGSKLGSAYNIGNIGMVYAKQNKPNLAQANINEAIKILEREKDYYPISVYLNYISDIYMDKGKPELALNYSKRSLELAKKYNLKDEISQANYKLSEINEKIGKPEKSLFHLKNYLKYKDSINNKELLQKQASLQTEFEVSKKQIELDLEKQKRKNEKIIMYAFLGGLILALLLAFGLFRRNRYISKIKLIIDQEKEKSDDLLLNILPEETAKELKEKGKVSAKKYESVTVLFTDFVSFTKISESYPPEKIVESVDMYFSEFDKIIEKYNLEKIKTIGDAYMCAGGLPVPTSNHAELIAKAAIEILDFVSKVKQVHKVNDIRFDIRIGIHSGPVVAGVVGKNKFSYDIWGNTVNLASRIESASESGKINVSESSYTLLKDNYAFESRGEIKIKNKNPINMYFLKSEKI